MVTMRTYSEEKRSGTIELLLTSPLTDLEIVLGKFLGAMVLYAALLAVTVFYIGMLFVFGDPEMDAGARPATSACCCSAAVFVAIGLFISSTTKNQMVAGAATFVVAAAASGSSAGSPTAPGRCLRDICQLPVDHRALRRLRQGRHRHEARRLLPELHRLRAVPDAEVGGQRTVEGLTVKRLVGLLGWLGVVLVVAAVGAARSRGRRCSRLVPRPGDRRPRRHRRSTRSSQWRDIGARSQGRNVRYGSMAAGSVAAVPRHPRRRQLDLRRGRTSAGT